MATAVAVSLIVQTVPPAQGGVFATEYTQVLNHAQLVLAYLRQAQQLEQAILQYKDQLRNVKNLPGQIFGPIATDINALATIVQDGMALSYSLANLDALFRVRFPGYGGYRPRMYFKDYQVWSQTSLDTTLGALRAAGLQGQQLQSEQGILAALRGMSQTADGRMQALNVLSQISEQQVQQLMKLRELMLADMSSKQAYQAALIQKDAVSQAATERFFNFQGIVSDGLAFGPGWH